MNIVAVAHLFIMLCIVLSGCSYNPVVKIEPDVSIDSNTSSADIVDKVEIKDSSYTHTNWKSYIYYISAVDGERLRSALNKTYSANYGAGRSMKILLNNHYFPAGKVRVTIEGSTYIPKPIESIGNNSRVGGDVEIELESGKQYRVNGSLYDGRKDVWIEDEDGVRLTGELTPSAKRIMDKPERRVGY